MGSIGSDSRAVFLDADVRALFVIVIFCEGQRDGPLE